MNIVMLMLTLIDADTHELSARQQRMTQDECVATMELAKFEASVTGDTVFGGCLPLADARVLKH